MLSQPAFGGVTVLGEMKQFDGVGVLLKDAHGADTGTFDDLKAKIAIYGMCLQNLYHHHTTTAKIALMSVMLAGEI